MKTIPDRQTGRLIQANRGDILGDLWSTFGIDLQDNPGAIRVADMLKINTSTADNANLGLPMAFKAFDLRMWAIAGTKIFKNTGADITSGFVEDDSTGVPTFASNSDLENFNSTLVGTTDTALFSKASDNTGTGAWTNRSVTLTTTIPHKLAYFRKFNRLYVTNNTEIQSLDSSWTVANSGSYYLSLPDCGLITAIAPSSQYMWIATLKNTVGSSGFTSGASLLCWDGISSQITREYKLPGTAAILSVTILDDSPVIIDSNGILRALGGTGFIEIGRLPLRKNQYLLSPTTISSNRFVHPNGLITTPDGTILVLVGNRNAYLTGSTENINENLPSGVWEWSKDNGFVHKHPLSYRRVISSVVNDYGQNRISQAGALAWAKLDNASGASSLICGATYYTDATQTSSGIFTESPYPTDNTSFPEGQKYGYFVTTWLKSESITESWAKIGAIYRQLLNSTDRIYLKYRTQKSDPIEISITWGTVFPSTTSFTTTTNVSGKEGYEVEIVQGKGSGKTAHIRTITESGGMYTVLLDEPFPNASGTAKARVQNWTKISTVKDPNSEVTLSVPPSAQTSYRVQIKCCMQFTGDNEVYEILVDDNPHK